jgi:hypothetical protein
MLAPNTPPTQRCRACGKEFTRKLTGRRKRYCNDHCRNQAHRAQQCAERSNGKPVQRLQRNDRKPVQRLKNGAHYPHEALQRNDVKSPCGTGTFLADFAGRGSGIHGPRHVIEAEIGGRNWAEVLSADGVRSYVRQIGRSALVERNNSLHRTEHNPRRGAAATVAPRKMACGPGPVSSGNGGDTDMPFKAINRRNHSRGCAQT